MNRTNLNRVSVLVLVLLSVLLVSCNDSEIEPTSTSPPQDTPAVPTPESDTTPSAEGITPEPRETAAVEAEVSPLPTASGLTAVIVSGDSAGTGKPFTFDATQSRPGEANIVNYVWTMGDGTTLFGISVQHAYSVAGFYTVNLIVTDADGQTDTEAKVVEIIDLSQQVTPTVAGQSAIVGTVWQLENAIRGTAITMAFDEEKITGSAGCNDYLAGYVITMDGKNSITIGVISASGNSCTQEVMAQERGYLDSLASASSVSVEGDTLSLTTGQGTLIYNRLAK